MMPLTHAGLPGMPISYYYDERTESLSMSRITRGIWNRILPESVVQRRRENYLDLYEAVGKSRLFRPLYQDLPDGVCPLCLPVLADNREQACSSLHEKGIAAIQWWAGFHNAFDWAEFPEAYHLKAHLLAIPVHQQLSRKNIDYIADTLDNISGKSTG